MGSLRSLPLPPAALTCRVRWPCGWSATPYYSSLEELQGWHLSFGEFSPTDNYRDQRFTVEWEDGSTTEVEFDLYIVWHGDEPDVKSLVRVDGVDHGSGYDNGWVVRISR